MAKKLTKLEQECINKVLYIAYKGVAQEYGLNPVPLNEFIMKRGMDYDELDACVDHLHGTAYSHNF